MDLKEKVKKLPQTPGVYLMKDKDKNIIYIGKSKCLKNRVSQYFTLSYAPSKKITRMIKFIDDIEIIKTDTELDALLLECKLIKEIQPMYNTLMKNDKKYAYLKIDISDEYPSLELCIEKNDNSLYFGPYTSMHKLEFIAEVLIKYFKIRKCKGASKLKGCINYDLEFCLGPCKNKDKSTYSKSIDKLINTLNGKDKDILDDLDSKMIKAIKNLDFESASKYKDEIEALKVIIQKSKAINYIKQSKAILLKANVDNDYKKIYILKGIDVLYSKLIKIEDVKSYNFEDELLDNIDSIINTSYESNGNYIKKEEVDISNIIYSYIKYNEDCSYIAIDKKVNNKEEIVSFIRD